MQSGKQRKPKKKPSLILLAVSVWVVNGILVLLLLVFADDFIRKNEYVNLLYGSASPQKTLTTQNGNLKLAQSLQNSATAYPESTYTYTPFTSTTVSTTTSQPTATSTPTYVSLSATFNSVISTDTPTVIPVIIFEPTLMPGVPNVIGFSVEGRPLEVYRFGDGIIKRMVVTGIHGGYEWNTIALADEIILYLSEYPDVVPPDITLYILRALNPDGEARDHWIYGRANSNGVDLNRNWDAQWQPEWGGAGCWNYLELTAGTHPGSEPETIALESFLLTRQVEALISYHSAGLGIFPGGYPQDPTSISLAASLASVSPYEFPPVNTGCKYGGQLADWASANGISAVDVELTNHGDTDFEINQRVLKVFLNWRKSTE